MKATIQIKNTLIEIIKLLFVILFVYAATSKLIDFENFRLQLSQSPILTNFADTIAYSVPSLEILLAIGLVIYKFRIIALYLSVGLMAAFSMYIIIILNFSDFIPCSCGGILDQLGWTEHLIFNLIFVVLGSIAIFLNASQLKSNIYYDTLPTRTFFKMNNPKKRTLLKISLLLTLSCTLVWGLFSYTNYKNHLPGSFIRIFPPHPISEIKSMITLEKDQFQFSGITKNHIYLNRKGNPLEILQLDHTLSKADTILLDIPKPYQLNLRRTEITINDLGVFITDGTTPILLKGTFQNWKLKAVDLKNNYFNAAEVIDTNLITITKLIPKQGRYLGIINTNLPETYLNPLVLQQQSEAFFSTDGFIHYNSEIQKLIYTYYYRNEYIILSRNLDVEARYRTIDTTTKAYIKIMESISKEQRTMATPPPVVNRRSSSQSHWLFNQSKIRAKNETEKQFKKGSVIDVYNFIKGTYKYSFYIKNIEGQTLNDFVINNNQVFALYPDRIVMLTLGKNYLAY